MDASSMPDVPLPERLADAEGELPTRLRIIADGDIRTMARDSLMGIHPDQHELHGWADLMDQAADALTAAESAREALKAEIRDLAMKQLASDAGWELEIDKLRAERDEARAELHEALHGEEAEGVLQGLKIMAGARDAAEAQLSAALARAERAEKALEAAVRLLNNGKYAASDWVHVLTEDGELRVQLPPGSVAEPHAALAHPATAEET